MRVDELSSLMRIRDNVLPVVTNHRAQVAAIILLGAGLRAYHLDFKSLWLDEAVIYQISLGSISDLVRENAERNSAPPLYPLLTRAVRMAFGDSEISLRMASLLFGVAAILVVYLVARRVQGKNAGLVASFLIASSVSQVRYSQQLREYSLSVLLAGLLLLALVGLARTPSWRGVIYAAGLAVVSVFTQYGLSLLVVSGILVLLLSHLQQENRRKNVAMMASVAFIAALAVTAVYFVSLKSHLRSGGFAAESYLQKAYWSGTGALSLLDFLITNTLGLIEFSHESGPLLALLVVAGAFACLETRETRVALAVLVAPIVLIVGLAVAALYPYHGGRQDIILTPILYVLGGVGASRLLSGTWHWRATAVLLVVLGFYSFIPRPTGVFWYHRSTTPEHARPVVNLLRQAYQPGDAIFSNWLGGYALRYYLRDEAEIAGRIEYLGAKLEEAVGQINSPQYLDRRTWIFISHCDGSCDEIHEWIRAEDSIQEALVDNGVWMYLRED